MSDSISYKRILLKISGEALASTAPDDKKVGIHNQMLKNIAMNVKNIHSLGMQIGIVVGGGNIYRGLKGLSSNSPLTRTASDHMGMLATVMNGIALQHAIQAQGISCHLMSALHMPTLAENFIASQAIKYFESGKVVIFVAGTGNPYFTTDTAATLRALELSCDVLLKATKVEGIYDKDPHIHEDAKFFSSLTYQEAIDRHLKVMDLTAITLAQENKIPIIVFSLYNDNAFYNVLAQKGQYTLIS